MKATVVIIPRIEAQLATGMDAGEVVDPAGVRYDNLPWPLFRGLNYNVPDDIIGSVRRVWLENGQLMGEIDFPMFDVSWGAMKDEREVRLMSVGLTARPLHPDWRTKRVDEEPPID